MSTSVVSSVFEPLSAAQRRAVDYRGGPLAVLAGPGAGKTRVIVSRVARLVLPAEQGGDGVDPASVVALAFTIKSAEAMRDRLAGMIGAARADAVSVGTCHSFGRRVLARFGDVLGLPPTLRVMDSAVQRRMLRRLVLEHGLFAHRQALGVEVVVGEAIAFIGQCQNAAIEPAQALAWCAREAESIAEGAESIDQAEADRRRAELADLRDHATLFQLYDELRLPQGRVTLDDFIALPVRLLKRSEQATAIVRGEARHLVIDEFQDWNPAQIELLAQLAPELTGRPAPDVCVVGDDDQSIYAFRGADDRAFSHFRERWPGTHVERLDLNYRSAAPVVAAGRAVIGRAQHRFDPDKTIVASDGWTGDGPAGVEGVTVTDDRHLGPTIGAMILVDRAEHADRTGEPRAWSSYAVLARSGGQRDTITAGLETLGIPVASTRPLTPLDDHGVLDLLAWMRLLAGDEPSARAMQLLIRPCCGTTLETVCRWRDSWLREIGVNPEAQGLSLVGWIETHAAEDEAASRFLRVLGRLRERTRGLSAGAAALEIIQSAGLTDADALSGRARARRVSCLGHVLGFIRACEPDLDAPGDLRAFLAYYADLSPKEQAFTRASDDAVDGGDANDEAPVDAVAVLTAHKAKGLEFDTVFVARCRPGRAGFPSRGGERARGLPPTLSGREAPDEDDEERRLFYVACTRAERRLVLLAKTKKSRSADYFIELGDDLGERFPVVPAAGWLERAAVTLPDDLGEDPGRDDRLVRAAASVRHEAARALADAERPGVTAGDIGELSAVLRAAVERLAMIAHLRQTGKPHAALGAAHPEMAQRLERLAEAEDGSVTAPMRAPLRLSYSMLEDYRRCPACFYVKHVLKFDELKTPSLTLGSAVHGALERFYLEVRDAEADGAPVPGLGRLVSLGEGFLRRGWPAATPVDEGSFEKVRAQLTLFWETLHDPAAEILLLEGEGHGGERVRPFPYEHGGTHRLVAKIDRVDRLPSGGFRLIDYKTGNATKRLTDPAKDDLQLSIYLMALQNHLGLDEPPAGSAEYWVVSTGQRGTIGFDELDLDKARLKINKAIDGMLGGHFPRGKEKECKGLCAMLGFESRKGG